MRVNVSQSLKGDAIGTMTKHWGGGSGGAFACCSEMFNASTHVLDFPKDATPRQKAALVGATLLIVSFKIMKTKHRKIWRSAV